MTSRNYRPWLFRAHAGLALLALGGASYFSAEAARRAVEGELTVRLDGVTRIIKAELETEFASAGAGPDSAAALAAFLIDRGRLSELLLTWCGPDGRPIADSQQGVIASAMSLPPDPEVQGALTSLQGHARRFNHALQDELLYLALPVRSDGGTIGVLRAGASTRPIHAAAVQVWLGGAIFAVGALALAWLWARSTAQQLTRTFGELRRRMDGIAAGDYETQLIVAGPEDAQQVADALDRVARGFQRRVAELARQNAEQDALLGSMVESVLAVDSRGRVLRMNPAAGRLFEVDPVAAQGRALQEVARHSALSRFVESALSSRDVIEEEIVLARGEERFLQAHGTMLRGMDGQKMGALVVLNDITRLRRLENIRRDFVANVSHELKTPITTIKGFVETLRDAGSIEPEDRERFLAIILKQADRLNAIIEDLLSLSRIEQGAERDMIQTEPTPLLEVVEAAIHQVKAKAVEKHSVLSTSVEPGLVARVNPRLIEQALVNLVDNAIKYSEPGVTVSVTARARGRDVVVQVRDSGPGIEAEHLPRLFERFYRVDRGRSRKLGGTGLGLAIVKHIALAHNGFATVESRIGAGSVFSLTLPGAATTALPERPGNLDG